MKKIYINPKTEIVKIEMQHLMVGGSETLSVSSDFGDADTSSGTNGGDIIINSRQGSFWDD